MKPLVLALSGGGVKCAAAAGVLEFLDEARLPVAALAGTSAGGLVAALYGLGHSPAFIRDYFLETRLLEVWELDPARQAIFGPERIRSRLQSVLRDRTFTDLKIPVVLRAVDLDTGELLSLCSGRLDEAVRATMALPGIFQPVVLDGRRLVDGGVRSVLPVDAARRLGPRVAAVDVITHRAPSRIFEDRGPLHLANNALRRMRLAGLVDVLYLSGTLAVSQLLEYDLRRAPPDVLIRPAVGHVGLFAFDLADEAFALGWQAAEARLPELEALAGARRSARAWKTQVTAAWRHRRARRHDS